MSRLSLDEIQSRVGAAVDQDENTANLSTTDYSLRLKYINRALFEWSESWRWQVLYTEYYMNVSTASANASISLPSNFRKLSSYPQIVYDGTNTSLFPEVLPQEDGQYGSTDKRVWILGSPQAGYVLRVLGASLSSGATVRVPYMRSPMSLVSPADLSDIPNPEFLVQRTIAQIWEAREDPRFPQAKAEAQLILQNMIEYENVFNNASTYDRAKTVEETKYNFRIGRN